VNHHAATPTITAAAHIKSSLKVTTGGIAGAVLFRSHHKKASHAITKMKVRYVLAGIVQRPFFALRFPGFRTGALS
jgi:hypothetical protein